MSFGYRKPRWSPPTISPDDDSASSSSHPSDPSEVTSNADMSDETKGPQTDYGSSMVKWMKNRRMGKTKIEQERPSPSYIIDMLPPAANKMRPRDSLPCKHLHSSLNKIKHAVNVVRWTPDGRRLLTGSASGEFTLWNGMGFNFETIMSAHEAAIREATYSNSGDWLVSGDQNGELRYWQPNFQMMKILPTAHESSIRGIVFCPNDSKFVTASDDTTIKIWDFTRAEAESTIKGHGWDVKCVDWHPTKGLLLSGSKDHQVKLWDPRSGKCLTTMHGHKAPLLKTLFERVRGECFATCARDQTARIFDIRMMRDVLILKGHDKDIMSLTWHPVHSAMLSTGGFDGALNHYILDEQNQPAGTKNTLTVHDHPPDQRANAPITTIYPAHRLPHAHELAIWSLDWHPLGHILATGSNDRVTRFWGRPRPGDTDCYTDRYHLGDAAAEASGTWSRKRGNQAAKDEEEQENEDEAEGLVDQNMPARQQLPGVGMALPGLPGLPGIGIKTSFASQTREIPSLVGAQVPNIFTPVHRDGTSTGGAQMSIPPPGLPGMPGGLPFPPIPPQPGQALGPIPSLSQLAEMFGGQLPPPIPPPGFTGVFPPPPPGFAPPVPPGMGLPHGIGGSGDADGAGAGGFRRRAPLPSQQDSLKEEMRRGNYRSAR